MGEKTGQHNLAAALLEMGAEKIGNRSKIGVLRTIYAEVEYAQNIGYSLGDILGKLKDNGFEMGMQPFKNALAAIRRERGLSGGKTKRQTAVFQNQLSTNIEAKPDSGSAASVSGMETTADRPKVRKEAESIFSGEEGRKEKAKKLMKQTVRRGQN